MGRKKNVLLLLIVLLAVLTVISVMVGRYSLSWHDIVEILRNRLSGSGDGSEDSRCDTYRLRTVGIGSGLSGDLQESNGIA